APEPELERLLGGVDPLRVLPRRRRDEVAEPLVLANLGPGHETWRFAVDEPALARQEPRFAHPKTAFGAAVDEAVVRAAERRPSPADVSRASRAEHDGFGVVVRVFLRSAR